MARDRGGPRLAYRLLIYPMTAPARGTQFASYRDNADGYLLTRGRMEWFWDHYLRSPEDAKNPCAAPLHAAAVSGLPSAMVVTAGFDPLRDEGKAYAERLQEAGVQVHAATYPGVIRGIFWMAGVLGDGRALITEMSEELGSHFG